MIFWSISFRRSGLVRNKRIIPVLICPVTTQMLLRSGTSNSRARFYMVGIACAWMIEEQVYMGIYPQMPGKSGVMGLQRIPSRKHTRQPRCGMRLHHSLVL